MSKKIIISALSAMVAVGVAHAATQASDENAQIAAQKKTEKMLSKQMPRGFEKCYGIAKAGLNDCASGNAGCAGSSKVNGAKNAWLGVPRGTCERIVGGSTKEGKEPVA